MDKKPIWKKIATKVIYRDPWIKLREDAVYQPNGSRSIYTVLETPPANYIIAEDKDESIYLIREYRYPIETDIFQLPAGRIGNKETELENAIKELNEETGIIANNWEKLGSFFAFSGRSNSKVNTYLATDLDTSKMSSMNQEGDESIWYIEKISQEKLKLMLKNNEIECGMSLAALNLYLNRK